MLGLIGRLHTAQIEAALSELPQLQTWVATECSAARQPGRRYTFGVGVPAYPVHWSCPAGGCSLPVYVW
jgi:hypothetical protein